MENVKNDTGANLKGYTGQIWRNTGKINSDSNRLYPIKQDENI